MRSQWSPQVQLLRPQVVCYLCLTLWTGLKTLHNWILIEDCKGVQYNIACDAPNIIHHWSKPQLWKYLLNTKWKDLLALIEITREGVNTLCGMTQTWGWCRSYYHADTTYGSEVQQSKGLNNFPNSVIKPSNKLHIKGLSTTSWPQSHQGHNTYNLRQTPDATMDPFPL